MGEPTIERCRQCGASPLPASRLTWATPVCLKCVRKTHDEWAEENASLERDLAELREALAVMTAEAKNAHDLANRQRTELASARRLCEALDLVLEQYGDLNSTWAALRRRRRAFAAALLPAEPPKEASDHG